jgi:hypothetical protein
VSEHCLPALFGQRFFATCKLASETSGFLAKQALSKA